MFSSVLISYLFSYAVLQKAYRLLLDCLQGVWEINALSWKVCLLTFVYLSLLKKIIHVFDLDFVLDLRA
jgi:hypothetical protein